LVTGGTFSRSYDGVSTTCHGANCLDPQYVATVSDFRLDKYEVTVGRFRKFVDAVVAGWRPAAGSGKHTHLNGGNGLAASGGGFEPGWDTTWNATLPSTKATWDAVLGSQPGSATWTVGAATNEKRPINRLNWFDAAAFCIWDGGFLASEAEWNYAAAGGNEQRVYPWSSPPNSTTVNDTYAVYCGGSCESTQDVGSKSPTGNGKYGQADLAGNVWEWAADWERSPYSETSCTNCAYCTASTYRVRRGGGCGYEGLEHLLAGSRLHELPSGRDYTIGARCARTP
jgi:formylglycine-generating enzyme required for sulfatase activity